MDTRRSLFPGHPSRPPLPSPAREHPEHPSVPAPRLRILGRSVPGSPACPVPAPRGPGRAGWAIREGGWRLGFPSQRLTPSSYAFTARSPALPSLQPPLRWLKTAAGPPHASTAVKPVPGFLLACPVLHPHSPRTPMVRLGWLSPAATRLNPQLGFLQGW